MDAFKVARADRAPSGHFRMDKEAAWLLFARFPAFPNCVELLWSWVPGGQVSSLSARTRTYITAALTDRMSLIVRPDPENRAVQSLLDISHLCVEFLVGDSSQSASILLEKNKVGLSYMRKLLPNAFRFASTNNGDLWWSTFLSGHHGTMVTATTGVNPTMGLSTFSSMLRWQLPPTTLRIASLPLISSLLRGVEDLNLTAGALVVGFRKCWEDGRKNRLGISYVQHIGKNLVLGASLGITPVLHIITGHTLLAGQVTQFDFSLIRPTLRLGGAFCCNWLDFLFGEGEAKLPSPSLWHVQLCVSESWQRLSARVDQKLNFLNVFVEVGLRRSAPLWPLGTNGGRAKVSFGLNWG
jgi:hypothetical protein